MAHLIMHNFKKEIKLIVTLHQRTRVVYVDRYQMMLELYSNLTWNFDLCLIVFVLIFSISIMFYFLKQMRLLTQTSFSIVPDIIQPR